ncbi:hypothetical protein PHMEG_00023308 [Phytophthora megakarya]|uniref:Uncharacterized protein n=1 Tax=Phytophthora megakarya TaxID=4795 RepID=A0A225VGP3_9STRA|nr:hypothetical protein PHMEG_00023308 [Phytophthora megakarya]
MEDVVAAAYRNACIPSECIHVFVGHRYASGLRVIWIAGHVRVLGGAVAYLHGKSTDSLGALRFYNYHLVDDHSNVDSDVGYRCADMNLSFHFAVTKIMGTDAVNEEKFHWLEHAPEGPRPLVRYRCMVSGSVRIEKIKGERHSGTGTECPKSIRTNFRSVMGSPRHVATCIALLESKKSKAKGIVAREPSGRSLSAPIFGPL